MQHTLEQNRGSVQRHYYFSELLKSAELKGVRSLAQLVVVWWSQADYGRQHYGEPQAVECPPFAPVPLWPSDGYSR